MEELIKEFSYNLWLMIYHSPSILLINLIWLSIFGFIVYLILKYSKEKPIKTKLINITASFCVLYVFVDLGSDFYCEYFSCTENNPCQREFTERYYNKYGSLEGFSKRATQVRYVEEHGTLDGFKF